jgi:iron complex outermembrane receptor protein
MNTKTAKLSLVIAALISQQALATDKGQNTQKNSDVFKLGTISVSGESDNAGTVSTVTPDDIRVKGDTDVGQAIEDIPGVSLQFGGQRAETRASIRGFDSRQITLNLDGIPIYIPYDGNIDLSRFRTSDLSKIEVTKSLGSLLEGPNNMGGSINLVTKRPSKPLEVNANFGVETGKDGLFKNAQDIQVGSRLSNKYYVTGGVSRLEGSDFPLSDSYSPVNPTVQGKGNRNHSGSESSTGNLKFGFTPNATDEYAISYYKTQGTKQSPPYAGDTAATGQSVRYWDWPQWDKESVYYVGHTQIGKGYLKSRLFYDNFKNKLYSYNDDTYTTITKGYAFRSQYDDHSIGGSLEGGVPIDNHMIKAALFIKNDEHKERDLKKDNSPSSFDQSWRTYQGHTYSGTLEDTIQFSKKTSLTLGYRHDLYELTKTDDGDPNNDPKGSQNKDNFQIKAEHELGTHTVFAGVSAKSRFPNMKDMFSYRMGKAIPNVNLKAEQALSYEVGSKGHFNKLRYQANVFYSDISDAIESVNVANSLCGAGATSCTQNQNVGKSTSSGLELSMGMPVTETVDVNLSYSYLDRVLADKSLTATNVPKNQVHISSDWFATSSLNMGVDWDYIADQQTSSDGSRPVAGHNLWTARAEYQINKHFTTNFVLRNVLDTDYEVSEGDPMPGRSLWMNVNAKF